MKKDAYDNSRLKHRLLDKKRNGVREVIWKLNPRQREFIENTLGFSAEPYLYTVRTRPFYNIRELDSLLKEIHHKNKRGISECVFKLNSKQKKLLDEFGVRYSPCKYRIRLCA